jgi:hypothetical protein
LTQFGQNPNQSPMYYGYAQADPYAARGWGSALKVCKAATIAQIALACFMLLAGCCAGFYGVGLSMQMDGLSAEQLEQVETIKTQLGEAGVDSLRLDGCGMVVTSLLQLALAAWIWGGRRWAIWGSIGAAALAVVLALAIAVYCAVNEVAFGLCFNGLVILLQIGLIVLLAFALRESMAASTAQAAYAAQWQQYYQQYQAAMYQQGANVPPQPAQPAAPAQPPGAPEPPRTDQSGGNPPPAPPAV